MEVAVWSDFACPWCMLGLARLDAALAGFEHGDRVQVLHRSFELDPSAPASSPHSMEDAVARKYGISREQVRSGHASMAALGRSVGIEFAFDRARLANTFDAHRLAQAARGTAAEEALVQGLFSAYFTEGRLLSDHGVLADVAGRAGLDEPLTEKVLGGDAYADDVRADERAAAELGVSGVPFFLLDGAWPIPGAQDVETLLALLRRAWARSAE